MVSFFYIFLIFRGKMQPIHGMSSTDFEQWRILIIASPCDVTLAMIENNFGAGKTITKRLSRRGIIHQCSTYVTCNYWWKIRWANVVLFRVQTKGYCKLNKFKHSNGPIKWIFKLRMWLFAFRLNFFLLNKICFI